MNQSGQEGIAANVAADAASAEQQPEVATEGQGEDKPKKARGLTSPPEVSEHNLRLVVNIIAARGMQWQDFQEYASADNPTSRGYQKPRLSLVKNSLARRKLWVGVS